MDSRSSCSSSRASRTRPFHHSLRWLSEAARGQRVLVRAQPLAAEVEWEMEPAARHSA